ncbi:hypothetical protein CPB84DRAFT_1783063 [Gymnopilus junonius]|uniref:Uncharacterized protein n=1 Tax=Gymnopilus junonius TaxID=109634 RepID=A0A9P5NMF5_GYMJU|nr:hypothetical protein CPB84DRAFT_1783063 [Gymnopilus junonius]
MARFFNLLGAFLAVASAGFVLATPAPAPLGAAADVDARAADLGVADIINALGVGLVRNISATVTLETFVTNEISFVSAVAGLNGTIFATFNHTFAKPGLVVPLSEPRTLGRSIMCSSAGALASLDIIPFGVLDLPDTNASVRAFTINGILGIPIPLIGLKQTYTLELGDVA